MTTIFDVAHEFIELNKSSIETVKLHKLCFYTFGWYAHLTGEPLFEQTFYAMQNGPVVGELLSAYPKQQGIDHKEIDDQHQDLDTYKRSVLEAVWSAYGSTSSSDLVKQTCKESVWDQAWKSRRPDTTKTDLSHDAIIEYFVDRYPKDSEKLDLPPAMISRASAAMLTHIESTAQKHRPFIEAVHAFRFIS